MTEDARRRALQAAAKLAAVTLAACAAPQGAPPQGVGSKTPAPAEAGNVAASPEADVTVAKNAPPDAPAAKRAAAASSDPSKASPPTQGPPPPGSSTSANKPASPEEIKACVGKLEAAIKTGSGPLGPRLATDSSLQSCCELLVHERKGRGSVFFSCCMALGDNSPACTPWGPPMPPTMPEAVAVAIV